MARYIKPLPQLPCASHLLGWMVCALLDWLHCACPGLLPAVQRRSIAPFMRNACILYIDLVRASCPQAHAELRATGTVVAVLEPSPRRESIIGVLVIGGSGEPSVFLASCLRCMTLHCVIASFCAACYSADSIVGPVQLCRDNALLLA